MNVNALTENDLPNVKAQYEVLPYPERDPRNEKAYLFKPALCAIPNIVTYLYAGHEPDWNGWRVLDAGCGTGDASIYLAEQLKGTKAEIVALDFSSTSLEIARKRAEVRGLTNITFVHASLLDLPKLNVGTFDFVVSSGVLHHLAEPEAGLAAIRAVMREDASLALMLYAKHGRAVVYMLQALLRQLIPADLPPKQRTAMARDILHALPRTHPWYHPQNALFIRETETDAGLFDLLLHSQDRPYTMPEVGVFLESAGLKPVEPIGVEGLQAGYNPCLVANTPAMHKACKNLSAIEQAAVAELLVGTQERHQLYATLKNPNPCAVPGPEMIPYQSLDHAKTMGALREVVRQSAGKESVLMSGVTGPLTLKLPPHIALMLDYWDGQRTFSEIAQAVCSSNPFVTMEEILPSLYQLHADLFWSGQSMLRHVSHKNGLAAAWAGLGG